MSNILSFAIVGILLIAHGSEQEAGFSVRHLAAMARRYYNEHGEVPKSWNDFESVGFDVRSYGNELNEPYMDTYAFVQSHQNPVNGREFSPILSRKSPMHLSGRDVRPFIFIQNEDISHMFVPEEEVLQLIEEYDIQPREDPLEKQPTTENGTTYKSNRLNEEQRENHLNKDFQAPLQSRPLEEPTTPLDVMPENPKRSDAHPQEEDAKNEKRNRDIIWLIVAVTGLLVMLLAWRYKNKKQKPNGQ